MTLAALRASLPEQPFQQRLLGVTSVLGLIPDALALPVEDLGGDLLARVRGQAVQRDGVRRGAVEQRVVDAVGRQCARGASAAASSSPIDTHTSV